MKRLNQEKDEDRIEEGLKNEQKKGKSKSDVVEEDWRPKRKETQINRKKISGQEEARAVHKQETGNW